MVERAKAKRREPGQDKRRKPAKDKVKSGPAADKGKEKEDADG